MGKKLREEDILLNIIVNGDNGKKEMLKLEVQARDLQNGIKKLEAQERKLRREGKQNTQEFKNVGAALREKNQMLQITTARITELRKGMDISKMSVVDLRREISRLTKLKNLTIPGSKESRQFDDRLKKLQKRYKEVIGSNKQVGFSVRNLANKFNHYFGLIAAGAATVVGAIQGIRKSIEDFTILDDKIADVRRTTGLTAKEAGKLVEALKIENFDSRTDLVELLGLAQIGGKLGQKGVENLERFVKANDALIVGLGDDLGDSETAVREVGKLVEIFSITDEFPIDEAIIKTGSLVNSLGMNSTAMESRIIDFMKRTSGLSKTFNIAIEDTAGLAATVDFLGNSVETAGTTFNQILPKMFKDTETFARIAGMSLEDFTDLLNNDVNEAFIRVLEGVKGSDGSLQALVERMGDLGTDGARVTSVISSLANNTDKLRKEQEFARKEFELGNSVLEEYALKNENSAAQLAKARKRMQEIRVELGEKLMPAMTFSTSAMSWFLKLLKLLIDFGEKYGRELVVLTTIIATYTIGVKALNFQFAQSTVLIKAQIFWSKSLRAATLLSAAAQAIFTGNVTRARAAMAMFNKTVGLNPLMLLVSVLAAVGVALILYSKRISAAEAAQKSLRDVELEAKKAIIDEKLALEEKLRIARDETESLENRKKAVEDLRELAPDYLGDLELETINTNKAKEATDLYIESLLKKARVEAAQAKLRKLAERELELETKGAGPSFLQKTGIGLLNQVAPGAAARVAGNQSISNFDEEKKRLETEQKALLEFIKENRVPISLINDPDDPSGGSTPDQEAIQKHYNMVVQGLERGNQLIIEKLRKQLLARKITQQQFNQELKELELAVLMAKKEAMQQAGMDTLAIEQQIKDKSFALEMASFNASEELILKEIDARAKLTDAIKEGVEEEKRALRDKVLAQSQALAETLYIKGEEISATEAAFRASTQAAAASAESAIEQAQTIQEAGAAVINMTREIIKAKLAQIVAEQMLKVLVKVPFPFNLAASAVAVGAVKMLFNKLIPAFGTGSGGASKSKESRPRLPGLEDGGFLDVTRQQDGKRFRAQNRGAARGFFNRPSFLVSENGEEFVANASAVNNPLVKPVLDIIDTAQKNGTINSLNLLNRLTEARSVQAQGFEAGGFNSRQANSNNMELVAMVAQMAGAIDKLNRKLDKPLQVGAWSFAERVKELEEAKGPKI